MSANNSLSKIALTAGLCACLYACGGDSGSSTQNLPDGSISETNAEVSTLDNSEAPNEGGNISPPDGPQGNNPEDNTSEHENITPNPVDNTSDNPQGNTPAPEENTPDNTNSESTAPNILLIITDDQGLDASAQYNLSNDVPNTPVINRLASEGLIYDNFWATPSCTTTRAALITGKHGVNNGVPSTPGRLDPSHDTIQEFLRADSLTAHYQSAVFGKWHIAGGNPDMGHPASVGVEHYAGNFQGNLTDYFSWDMTTNGITESVEGYHTSVITSTALDWINQQDNPWFAWIAYSAPHSPYHLPPSDLHQRNELSGTTDDIANNKRDYFLSAVEAVDSELGRLLDSLPEEVANNTLIIIIGDNGSPRNVIDRSAYVAASHGKGSLYDGGINVPLVVSGAGVERMNEREAAFISVTDMFATIAATAGSNVNQIYDGYNFSGTFTSAGDTERDFLYSETVDDSLTGWAVRNNRYKLIQSEESGNELYDLLDDPDEAIDLYSEGSNSLEIEAIVADLTNIGLTVRNEISESENPSPTEPAENQEPVDITDAILSLRVANCAEYSSSYSARASDVSNNTPYDAVLNISVSENECIFDGNAIPNHDFNDGSDAFPNPVAEQARQFRVSATPQATATPTALSLTVDNGILLNGVKIDLLAAACFGVGNEKTGCGNIDQPWRFDPMHAANGFRTDSHNAHTQPDGAYHYHGNPNALFNQETAIESPVIGFAADGFPIYGTWINDGGIVRKVQSSYQLISGERPQGNGNPGGSYDGSFRDDYEYIENHGDLDACNGMTVNGNYGYYVTDGFPYVLGCFTGSPHPSFSK